MCGIIAAVAERNVVPILLEGLRRLEYRGYDSAGLAGVSVADSLPNQLSEGRAPTAKVSAGCALAQGREAEGGIPRRSETIVRVRAVGKVRMLAERLDQSPLSLTLGIAHTRWATHGVPSDSNAHPHIAGGRIAIVHNGIIENHTVLAAELAEDGYVADSDTDSEIIALWLLRAVERGTALITAVAELHRVLRGAFALVVIDRNDPDHFIATRHGSPLVIGIGLGEHFAASDAQAIAPVTRRMVRLEDGDVALIARDHYAIFREGVSIDRPIEVIAEADATTGHEGYRHFMEKEIFEQPAVLAETIEGRLTESGVDPTLLGPDTERLLQGIQAVHFVACGTSYHAAMVARQWCEAIAGVSANAEVASEFRYRDVVVPENALLVVVSQSGETADTLSVLRASRDAGYRARLGICNRADSTMVREADATLLTRAGAEIGVASTKAFTTQLLALALLVLRVAQSRALPSDRRLRSEAPDYVRALQALPALAQVWLDTAREPIEALAADLQGYDHALFLGRGVFFPIALEGALKLKEISYIHSEAYPAGELKHGPLALIDERMPVVVVAPTDPMLEKLMANLQEVRARGGRLFVLADRPPEPDLPEHDRWIQLPARTESPGNDTIASMGTVAAMLTTPILMTLPLQLLAYHVARLRGTDVDRPRNLAKSVTVE
ncbi:MAG: glutamine--fructose-6-phosphate transaminase (isomerizing) [Thioalkalivibrionaceae bacterium]